jgi:hypothetical protein
MVKWISHTSKPVWLVLWHNVYSVIFQGPVSKDFRGHTGNKFVWMLHPRHGNIAVFPLSSAEDSPYTDKIYRLHYVIPYNMRDSMCGQVTDQACRLRIDFCMMSPAGPCDRNIKCPCWYISGVTETLNAPACISQVWQKHWMPLLVYLRCDRNIKCLCLYISGVTETCPCLYISGVTETLRAPACISNMCKFHINPLPVDPI